jgi:hypothetical protein
VTAFVKYTNDALTTGMPAGDALKQLVAEHDQVLQAAKSVYWDVERAYKYASEMHE